MATIGKLKGVNPKFAVKLEKAGIRSTEALLKAGQTPQARVQLAAVTGLPRERIMIWVRRSDLMRVPGVGEGYAGLLEQAGVNSVLDLANQDPNRLFENLNRGATKNSGLQRRPSLDTLQKWAGHAKVLSLAGDIIIDGPGPDED